ncbi:CPBP family intramembrane glutamic endopeptidase [Natronolimnohabitans innermongolicus]|uniref:CPBP family intramembrane glutamic endopeptidase n=1 Tax=Natronolimnohabitans innermongolicus TaxID=253107 RepID=UPI0006778373|nr:CPBP family intramembrane glutamic endopeptidase [Natronolimnohabitans innermongolicus]
MSTRRSIAVSVRSRSRAVAVCLALAFGGWFTGFAATLGVELHTLALGYDAAAILQIGSSVAFNVVGAAGLALTYLIVRRNGFDLEFALSFLRIRKPTVWDLAWIVFGLVGAFVVLTSYHAFIELVDPFGTGGEGETHSSIEENREYPVLFLVAIPIAIFLTGPGEELLYRGVIQSRLGESFPTAVAVVVASFVFAIVHLPVYMGDDFGAVLVSLGTVGMLGLYFGVLYELSNSLFVPALIHGLYNATVYLSNYLTYA